jgi:hypothetical protein
MLQLETAAHGHGLCKKGASHPASVVSPDFIDKRSMLALLLSIIAFAKRRQKNLNLGPRL